MDVSSCSVPTELAAGGGFACVVGPVAAAVGDHANEATVTATGAAQVVDAGDQAHYHGAAVLPAIVERPAISLTKSAEITTDADGVKHVRYDPRDSDEETVSYVFVVTNSGETALTGLTLTDDRIGVIALPTSTLLRGESITVRATDVVGDAEAAVGILRNTATAGGVAPDGTTVRYEASEQVEVIEVESAALASGLLLLLSERRHHRVRATGLRPR